jgi:hypothetical protein
MSKLCGHRKEQIGALRQELRCPQLRSAKIQGSTPPTLPPLDVLTGGCMVRGELVIAQPKLSSSYPSCEVCCNKPTRDLKRATFSKDRLCGASFLSSVVAPLLIIIPLIERDWHRQILIRALRALCCLLVAVSVGYLVGLSRLPHQQLTQPSQTGAPLVTCELAESINVPIHAELMPLIRCRCWPVSGPGTCVSQAMGSWLCWGFGLSIRCTPVDLEFV